MGKIVNFAELDARTQDYALAALATEFYGKDHVAEGVVAYWQSIREGNHFIKCNLVDDELVGLSSYKLFEYTRLADQLYYEPRFSPEGELSQIRLRRFGDFIQHQSLPKIVAEQIAYAFVFPEHRGKDYYRELFVAKLRDIVDCTEAELVFALTRTEYAATDIVAKGTAFMLAQEQSQHGLKGDGQVNVQGLWVDASAFELATGYPIRSMSFDAHSRGSHLTTLLAREFGFEACGFHRNFSVLFTATPATIAERLPR